jgi:ABC-2 type transport system permease protein
VSDVVTVYSAEIMRRLTSRTFWIGLAFGIVGIAAMMKFPQFIDSYADQLKHIVLAGQPALRAQARPLLQKNYTIVAERSGTSAPTLADLQHQGAAAVVALDRTASGVQVTVYAKDPSSIGTASLRRDLVPLNLELSTRLTPAQATALMSVPVRTLPIASKFGSAAAADAAKVIAYLLLVLLYILIMVNSQLILSSVAEEKTSRIAELLVASVRPSILLIAKVASSATLAVMQMIIWVAVAYALSPHAGAARVPSDSGSASFTLSGVSPNDIAGFVVFFFLGFVQMATLFAAAGSLINRTEDLGSVSGPLFLPVIAALFIAMAALAVPDGPGVIAASFIPLISPFVMFARVVVSTVPPWQIGLSLAINLAAIWGIALLGGKIYRLGILLYGRTPSLKQLWNAVRG